MTKGFLSIIEERNLISRLKAEVGIAYVNKMTVMLADLDNSKVEMEIFRKLEHKGKPKGFDFNIQILQNGAWDIDKNKFEKIEIPKKMEESREIFQNFYIERHKNHKLTWSYFLVILI